VGGGSHRGNGGMVWGRSEGDGGGSGGRQPHLGRQSGAEAMVPTAGERGWWRGCGSQIR
jgi:hypothetical protein